LAKNFFDFEAEDFQGKRYSFQQHKGKVLLVVNVASKCGYTPQYAGLETLYKQFKDQDFLILGFPCNQFGMQEPGANSEIQEFCQVNYGVTFPILSKVDVNGASAHPAYIFLKSEAPGLLGTKMIKWNFTKFLVGKNGEVIHRYPPQTAPEKIAGDIEKALKK
jgi:glutathione peroxidase